MPLSTGHGDQRLHRVVNANVSASTPIEAASARSRLDGVAHRIAVPSRRSQSTVSARASVFFERDAGVRQRYAASSAFGHTASRWLRLPTSRQNTRGRRWRNNVFRANEIFHAAIAASCWILASRAGRSPRQMAQARMRASACRCRLRRHVPARRNFSQARSSWRVFLARRRDQDRDAPSQASITRRGKPSLERSFERDREVVEAARTRTCACRVRTATAYLLRAVAQERVHRS